jgi:murein L,D-transpeptidase YcbB/YkuD
MVDRTERLKRRWLKVIDNKERLQVDSQINLKVKFDKIAKLEKNRKKFYAETKEEREALSHKRSEKQDMIHKRKQLIMGEFEKGLRQQEEHLNKRMQALQDARKIQSAMDIEMLNATKEAIAKEEGVTSEGVTGRQRAKSALAGKVFKANSSIFEGSCRDLDEYEEEEDLQRRLEVYESVLRRAENLR